jgi:hypothetical protein
VVNPYTGALLVNSMTTKGQKDICDNVKINQYIQNCYVLVLSFKFRSDALKYAYSIPFGIQKLNHQIFIPSCKFSFHFYIEAIFHFKDSFSCAVLDLCKRNFSDNREILCCIFDSSCVVFIKGDIQLLVQVVLNAPVCSDSLNDSVGVQGQGVLYSNVFPPLSSFL